MIEPRRLNRPMSGPSSSPAPAPAVSPIPGRPNPLERLCQITRDNDALLAELEALGRRRAEAAAYLLTPGCNAGLGLARLEQLRGKRSLVLARLRANRIEAYRILGRRGHRADALAN